MPERITREQRYLHQEGCKREYLQHEEVSFSAHEDDTKEVAEQAITIKNICKQNCPVQWHYALALLLSS